MKSRSVFERMQSRQPRARACSSAPRHFGNTSQEGRDSPSASRSFGGSAEALEDARHHLAVGERRLLLLDHGLELVVLGELRVSLVLAEDPRELAADAAVPVDERAVAVERRPALHARRLAIAYWSTVTASRSYLEYGLRHVAEVLTVRLERQWDVATDVDAVEIVAAEDA